MLQCIRHARWLVWLLCLILDRGVIIWPAVIMACSHLLRKTGVMSYLTGIEKGFPLFFFFFFFSFLPSLLSFLAPNWTSSASHSLFLFTCLFDFPFSSPSYLGYVQGWQVQHEYWRQEPKVIHCRGPGLKTNKCSSPGIAFSRHLKTLGLREGRN